ncbi:MAG: DNA-binding protein WhiA [Epulopiscium sp. Nuni2H_MBin003]|nr:MAG: DNA-binding protein WhiA [Epulopiscium sp. Nuni2H_MBin003]
MSFSSKIKRELIENNNDILYELLGYMLLSSTVKEDMIYIYIEKKEIYIKYLDTLDKILPNSVRAEHPHNSKRKIFTIIIEHATIFFNNLLQTDKQSLMLKKEILFSLNLTRAYVRGLFLGGGSLSDPKKAYHLEFVVSTKEIAEYTQDILARIEINTKVIIRRHKYVVYLKESSQIVDLLNIMGAHVALMEFENIRIVKEVRNNVNRKVNCELANLTKTVSAAVSQVDDIIYLDRSIGLDSLPRNLEEIARIRLLYKDATLNEIGQKLTPVVSKSAVCHRFKKISNIAEKLRLKQGGFKDD